MLEYIKIAIEKLLLYIGDSWQYGVFLAALLYLLFSKEEKKTKWLFVGYTLAFFAVFFCPVTAKIIMEFCIGNSVYWRMLWLLPIPLIIAAAGTRFVMHFSKNWLRLIAGVLVAGCVILSGSCVYAPGSTPYMRAQNLNKIPQEVVSVCDQIQEFAGGEEVRVTSPYEFNVYIRQYDASIGQTFGRRLGNKVQLKLVEELYAGNIEEIARLTRRLKGNYVIYPSSDEQHQRFLQEGYEQIGNYEVYRIYHDTKNRSGKSASIFFRSIRTRHPGIQIPLRVYNFFGSTRNFPERMF